MGVSPVSPGASAGYECSFKILLIGDSGVGKSSLLLSFVAAANLDDDIAPTIGVDFKIKFLTVGGKKLKLTIWDTAGQERFRTITSSYYRGAQGIILGKSNYMAYSEESFTNLGDVWTKEIDSNSSNKDCIKMLVGNKVDKSSAKTRENVENCFEELVLKILEVPSLLEEGSSSVVKRNILKQQQESHAKYGGRCCQ
ncbi:hypothetical protein ZWY2020_040548 [Hordeum vulgare]|nr:hypothetical protein ZWY2020_040548 [Hordeum vulgare]